MDGHIGISLGAIAAITAILGAAMAGLGAPWCVWTGFATWGVLWVIAALGLSDRASRAFLAGTLRKSNFTQIYTTLARRNVMWVWTRLCDPAPDSASAPAFFRAALTWRLYDYALRLAVAYPILLLVGQWIVTGGEGQLGSFAVLPEVDFWPGRAAVILTSAILTAGFVSIRVAIAKEKDIFLDGGWLGLILILCFLGIVFFAFVSALAIAGVAAVVFAAVAAVVFASAAAGAVAVALAVTVAVVYAAALAFPLAAGLALIYIIAALDRRGQQPLVRVVLTAGVMLVVPQMVVSLDWAEVSEEVRSLFVFLAVLPLLNALFDVVSYALTLSLIRRGLRSALPFLWGLADLAFACVLLLALGVTLVAVIHGLNVLAGVAFLDLPALFAGVQADPGAYVWLYLMLFSTLLPTLLHGTLSLLGVQGIWPRVLRRPVAGWVDEAPASPLHALRASFSLSLVWALPLLALVGVLWLIWHYAQPALMAGLQLYLDGLVWIAAAPVGAI